QHRHVHRVAGVRVDRVVIDDAGADDGHRHRGRVGRGVGLVLDGVLEGVGAGEVAVRRVREAAVAVDRGGAGCRARAGDQGHTAGDEQAGAVGVGVVVQHVYLDRGALVRLGEVVVGLRPVDHDGHHGGVRYGAAGVGHGVQEGVGTGEAVDRRV